MDALVVVLIAVLLTAFLFAPLGLGGGMLFVPILHYLADWPLDTATLVVSLLLTLSVSLGSGAVHHREGLIDLASVRRLAPFAMIGAAGGAFVVHALGDALNPVFKTLALALVVWASVKVARRLRHGTADKDGGELRPVPLRLGAGFGGGASAVLAIGAGAIYIPVLNQFGGLPDVWVLVLLPCAALVGAVLGARVGLTLPDLVILRVFLGLLVVIAARYLWDLVGLF